MGAAGGGGGAASAAAGVCFEEIRMTKNTEALDDSSYSYVGGGRPGPVFTAAFIRNIIKITAGVSEVNIQTSLV